MAQKKSSFKNYLVDFLVRLFGFWYCVKAEGNSPEKHNYRRCSDEKCRAFIFHLSLSEKETRCPVCKKVLLGANSRFGNNVWHNKKNYFYLKKPLYNPWVSWFVLMVTLSVVFVFSTYRLQGISEGFKLDTVDYIIWVVPFLLFFMVIFEFFVQPRQAIHYGLRYSMLIAVISLIFALFVIIYLPAPINGRIVVPIWREVPTEAEWREQQKAKIQKVLKNLNPGIEQFEVAMKNKDINARPYFVEAAKVDFDLLMQKHSNFVGDLDPYYGAKFYVLVQEYLESLDYEALSVQCCDDPWNIIYTPMSIARFQKNIEACFEFVP